MTKWPKLFAYESQYPFTCGSHLTLIFGNNSIAKLCSKRIKNKFQEYQIFLWINFAGYWGRPKNFIQPENWKFNFIYSNLNLHNPLTPHFVLILLKGLKIFQHMSCVTVIFCPIMFQKCWFLFLASDTNFAITQSNIGKITKSRTFLESALNGL